MEADAPIDVVDTLINYAVSSVPSPLQVSTSTPTPGTITITVQSQPTVLCNFVAVVIPIGTSADSIYQTSPPPTFVLPACNWSASALEIVNGTSLGLSSNLNYITTTLKNMQSDLTVTPFTLSIKGNVNTELGVATFFITESSSPNQSQPSYTKKTAQFPMTKAAAPALYISSFYSYLTTSPTIPASEFLNGQSFTLSWQSNGDSFKVFEKNNPTPLPGITGTSVTTSVANTTTFILVASLNGAVLYDTLTVTVSNPTLTPQSITSQGLVVESQDAIQLWSVTQDNSGNVTSGGMLQISHTNNTLNLEAISGPTGAANADALIISGNNATALNQVQLNATNLITPPNVALQSGQIYSLSLSNNGGGTLRVANNPNDNAISLEACDSTNTANANYLTLSGINQSPVATLNLNANQTTISGNTTINGTLNAQNALASFDQLQANYLTSQKDMKVNGTMETGAFKIGSWYISIDNNGNLIFGTGSSSITFNTNGTITQQ